MVSSYDQYHAGGSGRGADVAAFVDIEGLSNWLEEAYDYDGGFSVEL